MKMFLRSSGLLTITPVDNTGTIRVRATFRTMNIARSLSPLVNNLFPRKAMRNGGICCSERYTLEIINPVIKIKDGVKNRRYS